MTVPWEPTYQGLPLGNREQLPPFLPGDGPPVFLVLGLPRSGTTTTGRYLMEHISGELIHSHGLSRRYEDILKYAISLGRPRAEQRLQAMLARREGVARASQITLFVPSRSAASRIVSFYLYINVTRELPDLDAIRDDFTGFVRNHFEWQRVWDEELIPFGVSPEDPQHGHVLAHFLRIETLDTDLPKAIGSTAPVGVLRATDPHHPLRAQLLEMAHEIIAAIDKGAIA